MHLNLTIYIRSTIFFLAVVAGVAQVLGQNIEFTLEDFVTTGDTKIFGQQCFELTEDLNWKGGGVWYHNAIDLHDAFNMEIEVSFGCSDEGADGIVFIFHDRLRTGFAGEGMGFGGLYPSFGVEMDTYHNGHLADPQFDHVAYMAHGNLRHYYGLTEPKALSPTIANVEDCKNHKVKIEWLPKSKEVLFYFDGSLRVREKIDMIEGIFGGNSNVFWGFTSATGGKTNRHLVCVNKLNFKEIPSFSASDRNLLLRGGSYVIKDLEFASGGAVIPEKAKKELNNLLDFFHQNKSHTIILDGFTDSSGNEKQNLELSRLRAQAIADYLKKNGLSSDRILFYGNGQKNPLESNATEGGRKKNRRVEVSIRILKV